MKKHLILIVLSVYSFVDNTQPQTPMFSQTLWFEDAIGNIDSVIIGHDPLATVDIDAQFGEVEITEPFNAIFEVRVGTLINWPVLGGWSREKLSKKIITPSEQVIGGSADGCWGGTDILIYIWAKNQPVKVSWNRNAFNNDQCVRGSLITDHYRDHLITTYDWFRDTFHSCLSKDEELVFESKKRFLVNIEKEVEGLGVQTIYGLRYYQQPLPGWTPCNRFVNTNTDDIEIERQSLIYPNPAHDILNINSENIESSKIYDLQGKQLLESRNAAQIDVSHLSNGIYILETIDKEGNRQVTKV